MKLLTRISYILFTTLLTIFFMVSIAFYFILKSETEKEIRNELTSRMNYLLNAVRENPDNFTGLNIPNDVKITHTDRMALNEFIYKDTIMVNPFDNHYKQYKILSHVTEVDGKLYRIEIYKSMIESNELIEKITLVVTIIVILFILLSYLVNRLIFKKQWSGFFKTLNILESYDVGSNETISFDEVDIQEFNQLNEVLNQMTARINRDYNNLKEFTGNVSHEVQTPLTIIRQKAEMLLQSEPLTQEQADTIRDIQNNTTRLAKLVKSLSLLARIENKQFTNREKIPITRSIHKHLENFESFINMKNLHLDMHLDQEITIEAEPMLIDLILVNLIKNSIFHNTENGYIGIQTEKNTLIISNTSANGDMSNSDIFERYVKISNSAESIGLGLALVKKICDMYRYDLVYAFREDKHVFSIHFTGTLS